MSHSKLIKRGRSLYLEKWNPAAKRLIHTCGICGQSGYSPAIEDPAFRAAHRAVFEAFTKTLPPMALDEYGRCAACAAIQDKQLERE